MMPNYYLKFLYGANQVGKLVALAPDNHGTTAVGLAAFWPFNKILEGAFWLTLGPSLNDQLHGSNFMNELTSLPDTVPGVTYTVITTALGEIVTPHTSGYLQGDNVTNVTVQDICPRDLSMHVGLAASPTALHIMLNALDPRTPSHPAVRSYSRPSAP